MLSVWKMWNKTIGHPVTAVIFLSLPENLYINEGQTRSLLIDPQLRHAQ
jgi:hypothetical protein